MFLHNLLYQRQSDTGIAAIIIYRQGLKHHEDLVMVLRCDAGPIIGHRELIIFAPFLHGDCNVPLLILAVLEAVAEQVGKYLV